MTEKITVPVIDDSQYEVSNQIWQELRTEILRITALIDSGDELQPQDVNNVKNLAKQVRDYGVSYRRTITTAATNYKTLLNQELNALGYDRIEAYVATKRQEQASATSMRLNAKIQHFNAIIRDELGQTKALKSSSIANYVGNNLLSRFPKINSGAASREINNWNPIQSVVHMSIQAADKLLVEKPVLQQMPATSNAMRSISNYLSTGDVHATEHLDDDLMDDRAIIQELALRPRVVTDEATIDEIQKVINTDNIDARTKLLRIQMILQVHDAH